LYDFHNVLKLVVFLQLLTDLLFASATPTTATVPKATAVPSHTTLISFSGENSLGGFLDLICCVPVPDRTDPDQLVLRIHDILVWMPDPDLDPRIHASLTNES
jgi:hypothetical protein